MKAGRLHLALGVLAAALLANEAHAQYKWDVGVHLGGANYLGEMGGKEKTRQDFIWDMKLSQTRWAVGGFARYKINRTISINSGILYYRIQGGDYLSTNPARVGRNLSFRNDMFELYLRPEFTIFQDNDLGGRGRYRTDFRLFAYVGGALYMSNPKGQINHTGEFYKLRDMDTELADYSSLGFAVPAGLGFHFTFKRRHRIGWDFGWRTTFSDYLDDASTVYADPSTLPGGAGSTAANLANQTSYIYGPNGTTPNPVELVQYGTGLKRGDPTHNDSYLTMTFTYSYVLKGQSNFYRQRYNWMRGKKRIGRKSRAKF
ncbi:MAG: outer membrane beta-barrel protein [Bacteroidetes bacterium]|nr:outer membrane beta-barrel protein [Bacteroidota bacterium]MBS1942146.1 outer membrane beta-barrel protein [Bacteroidota bacterium]